MVDKVAAISNADTNIVIIRSIGLILSIVPTFLGVCYGLRDGVSGVCQSAELCLDLSLTIIPFGFITAPIIFSIIIFFTFDNMAITTINQAYIFCLGGAFCGASGMLSAYSIGGISRYACVTRAQQKKFTTQFFLMMIFGELIGMIGFIISIVLRNTVDKMIAAES